MPKEQRFIYDLVDEVRRELMEVGDRYTAVFTVKRRRSFHCIFSYSQYNFKLGTLQNIRFDLVFLEYIPHIVFFMHPEG